jgi:hypothetical protein
VIVSYDDNLIILKHYNIKIGIFDPATKHLSYLGGLSPTSDKQIDCMRKAFLPIDEIDLNDGFKLYPENHFSKKT